MLRARTLPSLVLLVVAAGCASQGVPFQPVEHPDQPLEAEGFSFVPIHGKGWRVERADDAGGTAVRSLTWEGAQAPEDSARTIITMVLVNQVDQESYGRRFGDPHSVLRALVQEQAAPASDRYHLVTDETTWVEVAGHEAARLVQVSEDREPPAGVQGPLEIELRSTAIAHPTRPRTFLVLTLSQRYPKGQRPVGDLVELERTFLATLETR